MCGRDWSSDVCSSDLSEASGQISIRYYTVPQRFNATIFLTHQTYQIADVMAEKVGQNPDTGVLTVIVVMMKDNRLHDVAGGLAAVLVHHSGLLVGDVTRQNGLVDRKVVAVYFISVYWLITSNSRHASSCR